MANRRLKSLSEQGVAVWLDDLSRARILSGGLAKLVDAKSVVGVTTNPSIFQAAIGSGDDYDEQLADCATLGMTVEETVRVVTTHDVRAACDVLRPVYDRTNGLDGRVSIEVDPRSARDEAKTIAEAALLWWLVDRPNLFIKIPATEEGLPAIRRTIAAGISVNVTLIFSIERYREVIAAYIDGIEDRLNAGLPLAGLESVASFFVSRVDTEIDTRLDAVGTEEATALKGKAALANARLAYQAYEEAFSTERWITLAGRGAARQRPLWASTGVKNPDYPDTLYVSELVAPYTVNTMPEKTMDAYAAHGKLGIPVTKTYEESAAVMSAIAEVGVDLPDVFKVLEDEGVEKFATAWAELYETVEAALAPAKEARKK